MTQSQTPPVRERQIARVLCAKADAGASGILEASRARLRRVFCFSKGSLVFGTSNVVEEQLVPYMVRTGVVSREVGEDVLREAARVQIKPIAYLLASKYPGEDDLRRAMEGLVQHLLDATLEWSDGAFEFEEGVARLDGEIAVQLAVRPMLLAHAQGFPKTVEALHVRIGPPDLAPVTTPIASSGVVTLDPVGIYLVARCDGATTLASIIRDSPVNEEMTLRTLYGLLLTGVLDAEDPKARREKGEVALNREECLGRLAMIVGQDYYGVLGVDRTARPKAIREAYYSLARKYHPDRFRSGPLADLLTKFEEFFVQVTQAHNTLADPKRRAEYDAEIAAAAEVAVEHKDANTGYLARQNFLKGRALAAARKYTEAVKFLENAVKLEPREPDFRIELGLVLGLNPRYREEAERQLLRAVDLSPAKVGAYVGLAEMYLKAGKPGRAARVAREALRWDAGNIEASQILAKSGNPPDDVPDDQRRVFGTS